MRVIEINEKEIKIKEGEDGKYDGATVWDAALVLCYFLQKEARKNQFLCDKQVIELGSGTGIVGIVSSVLGGTFCYNKLKRIEIEWKKISIYNNN